MKKWMAIKDIALNSPSLQDNTADADRLTKALKTALGTDNIDIELALLRKLPNILRQSNYSVRCILFNNRSGWILVDVLLYSQDKQAVSLAVDLGTTKVVLRLLDIVSGKMLSELSFDNPQISAGPDVLSRLHFACRNGGLEKLGDLIINGLNDNIAKLCKSCDLKSNNIYFVAIAGNTVMTHFFMGLNPQWLMCEPYIPVVNKPELLSAKELGVKVNSSAKTLIFPNVGSYFGGDLIAGILFSGIHKTEDIAILVDVGTNAEVVLCGKNWMLACAGAAGPALEGGVSKMGMTADSGAIDRVEIDSNHNVHYHTIGNTPPVGICGSGLIDLAAHLFLSGMIDIRGKFVESACGDKLKEENGIKYFVVATAKETASGSDICISQADIDSLVRAKAAMYAILETITNYAGIKLKDISTFYVAGTFGSFINPKSAISIGMLPDLPLDRYKVLGNSSIGGASIAATSNILDEINNIRDNITYLELNVNQDFMNRFSAAKFLPHTDKSLFPSS